MPNFENLGGNENDYGAGETPRELDRERGEKAAKAEAEARAREEAEAQEKAALEELARLKEERAKILAELGEENSAAAPEADAPTGETSEEEEHKKTVEKMSRKPGLKKFLTGAAIVALAGILAGGIFIASHRDKKEAPAADPTPTTTVSETDIAPTDETEEANPLVGELENGTTYDYTHYADRQLVFDDMGNVTDYITNKESFNAYDYDYSADFGDREAAAKGIMEVANRAPEALASYAYSIFTDAEKEELGIAGMSMTEIDDYMSNDEKGGAMQKRLLEKLEAVLGDETTNFHFYYEDDTEDSNIIYWEDDNNDGKMDPTELHLAYDTCARDGAPQVDIYRSFLTGHDKYGDYYESKKMIDLNLRCGYQPNYEKDEVPPDVPYVPANPTDPGSGAEGTGSEGTGSEGTGSEGTGSEGTGSEGTGTEGTGVEGTGTEGTGSEGTGSETTDWGKSGDPHTGDLVDVSDEVDPASEVTREESENANQGNQGYVDDHQAAPGSSSDNNGVNPDTGFASSGITAPGATTEGETRLPGGENQAADSSGNAEMAGQNAYQNPETIAQGQQQDNAGNAAQAAAQSSGGGNGTGATVGGDNYSDSAEEEAFNNGDF